MLLIYKGFGGSVARGSLYGGVLASSDADSPPKMVCPLSKLRHVSAAD